MTTSVVEVAGGAAVDLTAGGGFVDTLTYSLQVHGTGPVYLREVTSGGDDPTAIEIKANGALLPVGEQFTSVTQAAGNDFWVTSPNACRIVVNRG